MSRYPHLEGLRRLSPCCMERVAHPYKFPDLQLMCLGCRQIVSHFVLRNRHGQVVWPIKGPLPKKPEKRRKRRRHKPTEAEPAHYILHLGPETLQLLRSIR